MRTYRIAIGCDHAGFETKVQLVQFLQDLGHELQDFGTYSPDSIDYPDYARPVAQSVANKEFDLGIVLCGSGNGVNITANKTKGIRSALCWLPEIAALARQHNDANICAIPARFVSVDTAKEIAKAFLNAEFEGGRHGTRVSKIEPE
ncbi:ribose 5-phosphate isomerase B [Perlabentimonas gracilis]|jgi:ribose 5-phosphate isomerase B|uniref:ribose 5-phosphate isomerase B n=1 Tax=Perlabentimonas gracilis TaxID=2715279 RepID=UPI00140B279D|nr:ribose 5-phosphate isomerase B [Perlabentimonas gracilis]NHB67992.1 ribose 5-phosphate isomerase B [Perlabentimonas gracilis]